MPVDTSSYPTQPQQPNVLNTLGAAAQIQNVMNQNKLFQQQYNTNLALSNIYKEAIKPDGTIDQTKLTGLLQRDPNATYGLPQAYQQSQEAQTRNLNINAQQLQLARQHLTAISGYLAPLISKDANPTSADVVSALAHAGTTGMASPEELSQVYSTLPRMPNGQIDESRVKEWALQQQLNVMSASERLNALSPQPGAYDTGPSINLIRTPQIGAPTIAGTIQKGLQPGTPVFPAGGGQPVYSGGGGGGTGGNGGGPAFAGNPPGYESAANTSSTYQAGQGNALSARADRTQDNKAILGNLESELGNFTSGPGTESIAHLTKLVNANIPGVSINVKGLAAREQFNKLAGMLAQSQFQALGGTGTDAKLDATTLTSPNSDLSKMGNKGIIAMLKGNEDAIKAKNMAWQSYAQQHGPGSYASFANEFNRNYDPRAFQLQYLDPKEAQTMLSGMNANEKKDFNRVMNIGVKNGWVQLPQWLQGNGR